MYETDVITDYTNEACCCVFDGENPILEIYIVVKNERAGKLDSMFAFFL